MHISIWYSVFRIKNHANVSKTKVSRDLPSGELPRRQARLFLFELYLDNRIWFSARVKKIGGEEMSELLKRIQTGQRHIAEYIRPNADFICPVCKQESPCYASFVTLQAGYGSAHDGEKAKVRVCGECMDYFFACW